MTCRDSKYDEAGGRVIPLKYEKFSTRCSEAGVLYGAAVMFSWLLVCRFNDVEAAAIAVTLGSNYGDAEMDN